MKLIFLCIIFFFLSKTLHSQDVLVPYLMGDKYGLSDTNGTIVVEPTYEDIGLGRSYPKGYFLAQTGIRTALILNGKEIISGNNISEIEIEKNKCILVQQEKERKSSKEFSTIEEYRHYDRNRDYVSIYSLTGTNIYPDNFSKLKNIDTFGVSLKNKKLCRYFTCFSENFNQQGSVFVFDCDQQKISEWIIKDFYSLEKISRTEFKGKKTIDEPEKIYKISYLNLKFVLTTRNVDTKPSVNEMSDGYPEMMYDQEGGGFDSGFDVPIAETESTNKTWFIDNFKLVDQKILFERHKIVNGYTKDTVKKEISLPSYPHIDSLELIRGFLRFTDKVGQVDVHDYVKYTVNGKYGIVLTDTKIIKPIYDEIYILKFSSAFSDNDSLFFMVGQVDNLTKKMKYGTIDLNGQPVIPIIYDRIDYSGGDERLLKYHSTYIKEWIVEKNGKKGVISPFNAPLLDVIYDAIYKKDDYSFSAFYTLKKDGKYGLYKPSATKSLIIQPAFPTEVHDILFDYQGVKNLNLLYFVEYIDNDEENDVKRRYYGNENGLLYYKE